MDILLHSKQLITKWNAGQRVEVTHSAHDRGQVFPAQVEKRKRAVAGHIPDVGAEALCSCGQNKNTVRFGCGSVHIMVWQRWPTVLREHFFFLVFTARAENTSKKKKGREKQIITEIAAAQDKQPSCCLQPVHAHTLTSRWMTFDLSDMKCHYVILSFWAVVWNFVVILWYTGQAENTHQTVWLSTLLKSILVLFSAGLRKWAKCYQYLQLFSFLSGVVVGGAQTVTYSAT